MIHSFTSWNKHVCLKKRSQKTATEFREDDTFAYKANAHYKYDAKDQVIQIIFWRLNFLLDLLILKKTLHPVWVDFFEQPQP